MDFGRRFHILRLQCPSRTACLVIDVHLGDMTGFELQRLLAAEGVKIPSIFITAHGRLPAEADRRRYSPRRDPARRRDV
ncbi:MAG: hypothetical protein DMD91_00520 [Candidatus Rokuibacteriota bacterium]|nr:MAG: hypothetical protein DMD91_00520 [Candidatus Rokubacteria bacterium]